MKTRNSPKPKKTLAKKTPTTPTTTPPSTTVTPTTTTPSTTVTPPSTSSTAAAAATTTPKTSSNNTATTPKQQKTIAAAPAKSSTPKVAAKPKVAEASGSAKPETKPETKTATPTEKKVTPGAKKTIIKKRIVKVAKPKPPTTANAGETSKKEEQPVATTTDVTSKTEEPVEEPPSKEPVKETIVETIEKKEDVSATAVEPPPAKIESEPVVKEDEQLEKGDDKEEAVEGTKDAEGNVDSMEEDVEKDANEEAVQLDEEEQNADEDVEEDYGEEGFEEPRDEDLVDDTVSEPEEDAKILEEENKEISALAKERRTKKEQEIFVGGLDRDTVEDDIRKVFEVIGKVVDVRLHRNPTTKKNKGYAFVRFADKEHANKALSELKNPLIRGKRCGVAPSEDNDTLFVGNICNTWTKEAIKKKLKEFGLEGIENINLVPDVQQEGLSRGFAFVGFSSHATAMDAYKRLQKPDVVFGHPERTVKVAFAEPLRDPDPQIMAQVKSVFIDGLPQHWDEERVREHLKPYGEIDRVVLARNMPSAKRKDYGFVDFNTHEAAIACINGVNNTELGDDKSKTKVKVRLSNPLPKTQAVKGGLSGGFRIGRPGSGFSRFGRGLGQGARPFNRNTYQRGNESNARGRGRAGRFASESVSEGQYTGFRGRRSFGGQAGGRRGHNEEFSYHVGSSSRPNPSRSRYGAVERGRGRSTLPRRQPFSPEGRFNRPVGGREYVDDPYLYDDGDYGLKRPYSMMDHEPGYLEPSRLRPRFDHPDPGVSSRGSRYQDSYGAGADLYSPEYYDSSYGGGAYSSMYTGERSYGGRYYY